MANKTKPTPHKEEAREKGPETRDAPPPPLLDLSDDAVIKMIKWVKKRKVPPSAMRLCSHARVVEEPSAPR